MNKKRPNILLLFTDQQRADALHCAGNDIIKTPHLDALADEGIRFSHAVTHIPICKAARYGLITGLRPRKTHWVSNEKLKGPTPELPTLMTILSEHGYYTHGIGKFHFSHGRHHGFRTIESMEELPDYREDDDYLMYLKSVGYGHCREVHGVRNLLYQQPQTSSIPEEHVGSTWVANQAVKFIKNYQRKQPFFLWASWIAPHPPWNVPPPYDELYQLKDMTLPIFYERDEQSLPHLCKYLRDIANTENASSERLKRVKALYYAQVSLVDKGIGRILTELENRNLVNDTLVIFTSDHGEMLGDHNLCQKGIPYEGAVRVPLVMRWPGKIEAGHVSQHFATLLDILPTCLDASNLTYPGVHKLDGKSLLSSHNAPLSSRSEVIIEHEAPPYRWLSIRDHQYKCNFWQEGGTIELYDLKNDPEERYNIARIKPKLTKKYIKKLISWERTNGFKETMDGNRFIASSPRDVKRPYRIEQFPPWVQNLDSKEKALMEPMGETVMNAISREKTFNIKELDLNTWKQCGGDLSGTPYEEYWKKL